MNSRRMTGWPVIVAGFLTACAGTSQQDTAPISPDENAASADQQPPAPATDGEKAELLVSLDQNLTLWSRSQMEAGESETRLLIDNYEEILEKQVYRHFDVVLEFASNGDIRQQGIATAALGFSKRTLPDDPEERTTFANEWPPIHSRAIPILVEKLDSNRTYFVHSALLSLWKLGDSNTPVFPVLTHLRNEDEEIRSIAALTLSTILTPETGDHAISGLINALHDQNPKVRNHAITAVGNIRHQNASGRLAQLLNDESLLIQANAARALAKIGDTTSCSFLLHRLDQLLKDKPSGLYRTKSDLDIRREFLEQSLITALEELSGESYGSNMEEWHEWWVDVNEEQNS